jgi:competence protein ComGE
MWLKNDGLILAELLLSLSCLLMLGLFFIPLIIDFKVKDRSLQVEKQAYQLLYDELYTFTNNPLLTSNHSVIINEIEYQIFWQEIADSGQKEVCVKVEKNHFQIEKSICKTPE